MELADTPRGEGLFRPENRQRLAAGAVVALLHVVALFMLLNAGLIHIPPVPGFRELPITIWLNPPKKPQKLPSKPVPSPEAAPEPLINRTLNQMAVPQNVEPPSAYNGLRALGRYMKNCSAGDYGYLSKQEWQLCLGGQKPPPFAVGLGQEAPSVWQQQRDAARKAEAPFEQPCPQGTLDSNLGLPCQHFSGSLLGISPQPRQ